jgi:hypothetical protein
MIFLNWIMLLGLAALAIPVIIHLLNRAKARQMDWGAMRFLLASVAARRRRLILEDVLLLIVRCLAITFIAVAMARPFLPSSSIIPSAFVLPAILIATVLAATAAAFWNSQDTRKKLLRTLAGLLIVAALASFLERWLQSRRWFAGGESRDTVILLDGSTSMMVKFEGKTNFERALEEAKTVVDMGRPGDAVAIIVAGPVPRPLIRTPTADRKEIASALDPAKIRAMGGSLGVLEALNAAAASLLEGHNPMKRIVLITDGQDAGWDVQGEGRWKFIGDTFKSLPSPPQLVCRKLPMPATFRNAAVSDIAISRSIIGTDRPVKIDAKISNSGTLPLQPSGMEILVDGIMVTRETLVKEIPPGAAETIRFEYRFETPGRHVVTARIIGDDDLPTDNSNDRVVDVQDRLSVLLVDGAPAERFFQGAAAFARVALMPREETPATPPSSQMSPSASAPSPFLMNPKVVKVTEMDKETDLETFHVIVLANVPRLPARVIDRLDDFVKNGGGLLIAPGRHAEADFYNKWRMPTGQPLMPASLIERTTPRESPAHLELKTMTHPAFQLIANPERSDAGSALVRTFWKLATDPSDPDVRIGGTVDSGEPFLVERRFGKGYILMTSVAMDRKDSNLPSLKCFLPFIHELVYYLAAPMVPDLNIRPGIEMAMELNASTPGIKVNPASFAAYRTSQNPPIEVITPSTNKLPAIAKPMGDSLIIRFAATQEPGLYRFVIPSSLATRTASTNTSEAVELPFSVLGQGQETSMNPLTESDIALVRSRVGLFMANSHEDMITAFGGDVPGREVWRYLALCALLLLIVETGLTRWIAIQRRFNNAEVVTLRSPIEAILETKGDIRNLFTGRTGGVR